MMCIMFRFIISISMVLIMLCGVSVILLKVSLFSNVLMLEVRFFGFVFRCEIIVLMFSSIVSVWVMLESMVCVCFSGLGFSLNVCCRCCLVCFLGDSSSV